MNKNNDDIKQAIFKKWPNAIIDYEFAGEVQFFVNKNQSNDYDNLWSAYRFNGEIVMTNDF